MKPITIEGCPCVVGRQYGHHSTWIVREPVTGLLVGNPGDTRKEAIAAGGAETFNQAIRTHENARP